MTVSVTVAECIPEAAAPVTVRVYIPAAAVPAFTVSVELPPDEMEPGLSVAVAPAGAPETFSVTASAAPDVIAVEIVLVPDVPGNRFRLPGLAEIEKSFGGGLITSITEVE
jgi:hypothetical protein